MSCINRGFYLVGIRWDAEVGDSPGVPVYRTATLPVAEQLVRELNRRFGRGDFEEGYSWKYEIVPAENVPSPNIWDAELLELRDGQGAKHHIYAACQKWEQAIQKPANAGQGEQPAPGGYRRVILNSPNDEPMVDGKYMKVLPRRTFEAVKLLLDRKAKGKGPALTSQMNPDHPKLIRKLAKSPGWSDVIQTPRGKRGAGYCLVDEPFPRCAP